MKIEAKKITYAERQKLKDSDFAIVMNVDGKKIRKYIIKDLTHARNALARVSQFGTPEEQKIVRKKVAERFPKINQETRVAAAMRIQVNMIPKLLRHVGFRPRRRQIEYGTNATKITTVFASPYSKEAVNNIETILSGISESKSTSDRGCEYITPVGKFNVVSSDNQTTVSHVFITASDYK